MLIASGFSWFHLLPGVEGEHAPFGHHTYLIVASWLAAVVVIGFAALARVGLSAAMARPGAQRFEATDQLSPFTVAEFVISAFKGLMDDMMEAKYTRLFLPLVAALAIYIFVCNAMGLIPGFLPPTDNINHNLGMALTVMLTYVGVGLVYDPKGFIHHIIGPVWWLSVLFIPLETLTYLVIRPGSLTIRLAANMFGDHMVFGIMSDLVPLLVPVPFLILGLLVSTIQAGVFALLTTVYISMSLPHGEHHDEAH
jgi:F-type H+-transporting ATPase subunit a